MESIYKNIENWKKVKNVFSLSPNSGNFVKLLGKIIYQEFYLFIFDKMFAIITLWQTCPPLIWEYYGVIKRPGKICRDI